MRRLCAVLLAVGCVLSAFGANPIRQRKIAGRNYFSLYDLLKANRFAVKLGVRSTYASGRRTQLQFDRGKRRMLCFGRRVELCFMPVYDGSIPYLAVMDWQKTLRPLLYPATVPAHPVRTVYLDFGHGGNDPGAIGAFSKEKDLTLAIGRRTAALLHQAGFRVILTRNTDVQIPLAGIGKRQQRSKSDIFLSIHINSAADRKNTGIETFCLTPAGASSSNGGKPNATSFPGNRFDANNILLAWHIQQAVLNSTGGEDRGVKRARFAVLRDLNAPGALVEVGFISNRAEEKKLNSREYQERIAKGIVAGVVAYGRTLKRKP